MKRVRLEVGARFGRLVVVADAPSVKNVNSRGSRHMWRCRCDCGTEIVAEQSNLRCGLSTSCGCQRSETCSARLKKWNYRHGLKYTPEYQAWAAAKDRCTNPKNASWKHYGGRGIRMDPVFAASFEAFYAEVGPRPGPEYSIDRKDVNGYYAPGNLRWATVEQQLANRRFCIEELGVDKLKAKIAAYEARFGPLPD
jgi:hypothetical protein